MAAMSERMAFLNARLAADEAGATGCMNCGRPIRRETTKTGWTHGARAMNDDWQGVRCPGKITGALPWPDPARVLREVESKRKLMVLADPYSGDGLDYGGEWILEALATVYSDHPDYDPETTP